MFIQNLFSQQLNEKSLIESSVNFNELIKHKDIFYLKNKDNLYFFEDIFSIIGIQISSVAPGYTVLSKIIINQKRYNDKDVYKKIEKSVEEIWKQLILDQTV